MAKLPALPERRGLLIAAGLSVLSVPLLKRSFGLKRGPSALPRLRPPGALAKQDTQSELDFQSKCIRCGKCMKVCPTNGLQPLLFESGLTAMWSPVLVPRVGNCRHYCNACGQVCPTGAIAPLLLEEKQEYKIGLAYFDTTRCIPYVHPDTAVSGKCLTCEEFCPVPEKAIEHYEKEEPYHECPANYETLRRKHGRTGRQIRDTGYAHPVSRIVYLVYMSSKLNIITGGSVPLVL
ncbi:MAG: 4Fe-4S dicluster domain-containing protein [Planctomycetes bacterium]|nr:4Fe-4S dicluster domain-containing protein [Planctomycetota bacterium]